MAKMAAVSGVSFSNLSHEIRDNHIYDPLKYSLSNIHFSTGFYESEPFLVIVTKVYPLS
ncbi:hypothetical protein P9H32_15080 [Pontiella sp. NLcol2]|uniref:Uncharacterized protein n=1 Tax=Pontiella agarivorans TaxID=3038953 RepID=A0ABU5N0H9_9BACT|nr:hypothetical protein [Pontiella agarivorans]